MHTASVTALSTSELLLPQGRKHQAYWRRSLAVINAMSITSALIINAIQSQLNLEPNATRPLPQQAPNSDYNHTNKTRFYVICSQMHPQTIKRASTASSRKPNSACVWFKHAPLEPSLNINSTLAPPLTNTTLDNTPSRSRLRPAEAHD